MSEEENTSGVNWSPFLIRFLSKLIIGMIIPHFFFWVPFWLQLPPLNLNLGWELLGMSFLPSLILNVLYLLLSLGFIGWAFVQFDYKLNRWPVETRSDQVSFEQIKIPIGGGHFLPGDLVKGPLTPKKNAPVLILCHGLGGQRTDYYAIGIPLCFMGFSVLFYDSRGHGDTTFGKKWDTYYIIKDLSRVVDFIETRSREIGDIDSQEIVAWGASMGGGIVLNEGYLDQRIKFIVAVCTWADFQLTATRKLKNFSERMIKAGYEIMGVNLTPTNLQNRMVSPILNSFNKKKGFFDQPVPWDVDNDYRVMLGHCEDDEVVSYENFELNRKFLNMKPENYIVFKKGNHAFAGVETALIGKMLLWFWQRGY